MHSPWQAGLEFLHARKVPRPEIGVILGTGMHQLTQRIEIECEIPYAEIPYFPLSTVESHAGVLVFGKLSGKNVVAMKGRFHPYEGYSYQQIRQPIRILKELGIHSLLLSNAAGALNPELKKGDLMLISDHINLHPANPLIGPNDDSAGPRFPDLSEAYDSQIRDLFRRAAKELDITLHRGIYVSVPGPMLETRAEYRFLRRIGADAVGMSTVPEVIAARQLQLRCAAISVLTDECDPDNLKPVTLDEIIKIANEADSQVKQLFENVIESL